jgi:hypothetical protein
VFSFLLSELTQELHQVALIDDGINLAEPVRYEGVELKVRGDSFSASPGEPSTTWYRSRDGHGTIMANMILRVNPWASLHAMKLAGDSSSGTLSAHSAAEAIQVAVDRGVDIISMSWTIKQKIAQIPITESGGDVGEDKKGLHELEEAIKLAASRNILMFCSASDNLEANAKDSLPYGAAPHYLWRIGAADAYGRSGKVVEAKHEINYFFPGKNVMPAFDPRSKNPSEVESVDGSSVATAFAAGLASLIKYCPSVLCRFYDDSTSTGSNDGGQAGQTKSQSTIDQAVISKAEQLRTAQGEQCKHKYKNLQAWLSKRENMELAFKSIRADNWDSSSKFLPVWGDTFGQCTTAMKGNDPVVKMASLENVAAQLCAKANYIAAPSFSSPF